MRTDWLAVNAVATVGFVVGLLLILSGLCPMAFALGVASNVADVPGIAGGAELERGWCEWAYSPQFLGILTLGAVCAGASLLFVSHGRRIQYVTLSGVSIAIVAFVTACSSGWLLF